MLLQSHWIKRNILKLASARKNVENSPKFRIFPRIFALKREKLLNTLVKICIILSLSITLNFKKSKNKLQHKFCSVNYLTIN